MVYRQPHIKAISIGTLLVNCIAVLSLSCCGLSMPALGSDGDFPGVRNLMSDSEFRSTGLHKLTTEEINSLNAWLIRYTAGEAELLKSTSSEVKRAEEAFEVRAAIVGDFDGWSGDTVFHLDNGQVWQQRVAGRHQYSGEDTRVVIRKGWLGLHVMELEANGRRIGVTRLR